MKAAIAKALETPEPETENIFERLLKQPSKKKEVEHEDISALKAQMAAMQEQINSLTVTTQMKKDAEIQSSGFLPRRAGAPWRQDEDNYLIHAWEKKMMSVKEIAEELKRTERAIEMRLELHGYPWQDNYNLGTRRLARKSKKPMKRCC